MPSIDALRRQLRRRTAEPVALPDLASRWKYSWDNHSIKGHDFAADVEAHITRSSIVDSTFPGVTLLAGEHCSISGCLFRKAFTVDGDNMNIINCAFDGPVRYRGERIQFQGCHFKAGSPMPLDAGGTYEGSGNIADGSALEDISQLFELSLHTSDPTPAKPHEAKHGGYKRIQAKLKRERSTDPGSTLAWWTNENELLFPQCTGGNETITHIVARPVGFDSDDDEKVIKLPFPLQMFIGKAFVIDPKALTFEL